MITIKQSIMSSFTLRYTRVSDGLPVVEEILMPPGQDVEVHADAKSESMFQILKDCGMISIVVDEPVVEPVVEPVKKKKVVSE